MTSYVVLLPGDETDWEATPPEQQSALSAGLPGYGGYLIRPDGSEADTGGIDFVR